MKNIINTTTIFQSKLKDRITKSAQLAVVIR